MTSFITTTNEQEQEEVPDITDEQSEAKFVKKFQLRWPSLHHWRKQN